MTIQLVELVAARVIWLPSNTDATKLDRKYCSRSGERLLSSWNGYSRAKNRSASRQYLVGSAEPGSVDSRKSTVKCVGVCTGGLFIDLTE